MSSAAGGVGHMTEVMTRGGAPNRAAWLQSSTRNHQHAKYVRLGQNNEDGDEDLEIEEFELPLPEDRQKRVLWWVKVSSAGLILIAIGSAIVFWGVPLILDKVLIPMLIWEASTFSKPLLSLVLILSLALFPIIILPSGPSMWLSGMIFGYGFGFIIIMVGTFFGQTLPYFIGRWLFHERIQEFLNKWPKQAAVLRIAEQGSYFYQFRSVAILRVSPVPYPWFNYAITGTTITYGPYIAGSMAGMVPEAFITIYSGKMLKDLADLKKDKQPLTWPRVIYYMVNFSLATAIGVAVMVLGRRALADLELKEAAEREEHERQMRGS
ncbi:unnamed protein product [Calypogeia fissa]